MSGVKIYGPYEHGDRWRVHVVERRGGGRKTTYQTYPTRALADAFIAGARDEAQGITVKSAIEAFVAKKRDQGRASTTLEAYETRLSRMMEPVLERPIRAMNTRGAELYAAFTVGRSPDHHQRVLVTARSWGAFCVKQQWLKSNPFADVEPVGRKTLGADKERLSVDESRKLEAYCIANRDDQGAVLTYGYLILGPRAGELVHRVVRDLDDGGRLLWIGKTKTAAGRRRLLIPDVLADMLLELAEEKGPDEPLFAGANGRMWSRWSAWSHVKRVLGEAGVPRLNPQALRRTQATLATEAGATGLMVADHLGHESTEIAKQSYIGRDAQRQAAVERSFRVINGGRSRSVETPVETPAATAPTRAAK